jgi:branched-chain amino acid transport system ATP-binding protein
LALQNADRGYVLEAGSISTEGNAADLLTDERVRKAYLG